MELLCNYLSPTGLNATVKKLFFLLFSALSKTSLKDRCSPPPLPPPRLPPLHQPWATVTTTSLHCQLTLWPPCRSFTTRPAPARHRQTSSLWEQWRRTGWVYWVEWRETEKLTQHLFCVLFSKDTEEETFFRNVSADFIGLSQIYSTGVYLNQYAKWL